MPSNFTYTCNTGFSGDGPSCTDVDECTASGPGAQHNCDPDATCVNIHGSFACSCNSGFAGSGTTCSSTTTTTTTTTTTAIQNPCDVCNCTLKIAVTSQATCVYAQNTPLVKCWGDKDEVGANTPPAGTSTGFRVITVAYALQQNYPFTSPGPDPVDTGRDCSV
uniref:EGF-like domain-containing protein n=1 Tax=Chromera velia CCMP2878 TaxID=1169474 RepID=A0A0G4I038_9ALVE|eukprot:Cvel_9855.t1-p1 / transcript=Cvel_9855.t1 / gene=Cvel_9855 / organism=Chromera_velia_CCMP2878 / gene_product=Nidogen-1, putative / transcript_product=Nidogen-1, putative / location=Cvel_scaffold580:51188-51999(+) / protein_length=163 / sequence_SO=supercontig / SO=protein_coding / is_pseudo=false